jgi:hypothetical protein
VGVVGGYHQQQAHAAHSDAPLAAAHLLAGVAVHGVVAGERYWAAGEPTVHEEPGQGAAGRQGGLSKLHQSSSDERTGRRTSTAEVLACLEVSRIMK